MLSCNRSFLPAAALFFAFIASVPAAAQLPYNELTVREIRFDGIETVKESYVRSAIRVEPDLIVSERELRDIIRDDIRRVYRLGAFERVDVYLDDLGGGSVDVVFVLEERPYVREVLFEDNEKIKTKKLEEKIKLSRGDRLSLARINADIKLLEDLYFEKGFRFAKIKQRIDEVEDGVEVVYVIKEGPKAVIKKIVVEGNEALSDWYITNKVMKTKVDRFYNTKILDEDLLEEDFDRIEKAYADKGYVRARVVDHRVEYNKDRNRIDVYITVEEGEEYYEGDISFIGNEKYEEERLLEEIDWRKGKPYSENRVEAGVMNISSLYRNNGHLFSSVDPARDINDDFKTVNLTVRIREGSPARVRRIDIYGNVSTKDKVIRREMRLHPGDVYKENRLIRTLQRLANLGYFDDVVPDIKIADPQRNQIDILLDVTEKANTAKFNFGAGYSSLDGLVGTFSVDWINFDYTKLPRIWKCKGAGQELRFSVEFGRRRNQFNVGFTEPYIFDTPTLVGFDLYKQYLYRSYYDERRTGFNIFVGRPLTEYVLTRWAYKFESVEVASNYSDRARLPSWIHGALGRRFTSSVSAAVERDSRDYVFFPRSGSDSSADVELAGSFLGGDVNFYRITLGSSWYFGHIWKTALAIRIRGGYVDRFGSTDVVPVYERFYIGGAKTVRGYGEWRVGPMDIYGNPEGGKAMLYTNVEYRIPISEELFHIIFFWDAGSAWRELRDINLQDMVSGVGGGIRLNIPMMGLMGIDYGYGIAERSGEIHFSLGSSF
jgi:outer membrane protein insertion porin family